MNFIKNFSRIFLNSNENPNVHNNDVDQNIICIEKESNTLNNLKGQRLNNEEQKTSCCNQQEKQQTHCNNVEEEQKTSCCNQQEEQNKHHNKLKVNNLWNFYKVYL